MSRSRPTGDAPALPSAPELCAIRNRLHEAACVSRSTQQGWASDAKRHEEAGRTLALMLAQLQAAYDLGGDAVAGLLRELVVAREPTEI